MNFFTTSLKSVSRLVFFLAITLEVSAHIERNHSTEKAAQLEFKNGSLIVQAYFKDTPLVGKRSVLFLETRSSDTSELIDIEDQIRVTLWMPTMNHGSSPTRVTKVIGEIGLYQVSNVNFIMGGLWEVRVTLTDKNNASETQTFEMEFPERGHHHRH